MQTKILFSSRNGVQHMLGPECMHASGSPKNTVGGKNKKKHTQKKQEPGFQIFTVMYFDLTK